MVKSSRVKENKCVFVIDWRCVLRVGCCLSNRLAYVVLSIVLFILLGINERFRLLVGSADRFSLSFFLSFPSVDCLADWFPWYKTWSRSSLLDRVLLFGWFGSQVVIFLALVPCPSPPPVWKLFPLISLDFFFLSFVIFFNWLIYLVLRI